MQAGVTCCPPTYQVRELEPRRSLQDAPGRGAAVRDRTYTGWGYLLVAAPVQGSLKEAQRGAAIEILNRVDGEAADREAARLRTAGT